jgi:hypothetical protein
MAIQTRRRQHMGVVDRDSLSLMDGGGVTVIDMGKILQIEGDVPAIVEVNGETGLADLSQFPQHAIFNFQTTVIFEDHDPLANSEVASANLKIERDILTQFPGAFETLPRLIIEGVTLVIGVNQNDPAGIGALEPILVPPVDQILAGLRTRRRRLNGVMVPVALESLIYSAYGQIFGGVPLPAFLLSADFRHLNMSGAFSNGPEGCACLDRLKLLWISNQNHFGLNLSRLRQQTLHLADANHAGFINDEDVLGGENISPLREAMLQTGDGPGFDPGTLFKIFRCDAGKR